jgi:nitroreductase
MADVEGAIRARYSCRKFLDREVATETVERILGLAQQTPSWCNTQPWQVTIVSGAALARLGDCLYRHAAEGHPAQPDFEFPPRYEGVYRDRRKVCGVQLYQSLGIAREDRAAAARQSLENYRFFGAPRLAMVSTDATLGVYGAIDCGLYIANFMLAARHFGVDSIAQAALAAYPELVRRELGLPADRLLVCGVSFGYGDTGDPVNGYRTERASVADAVRWLE